ncbi:DAGKc domain-containing protein OS=Streptomyces glaucescens OX=1907 GN=SGLAU_18245 PE=4 SV=1 [Streptomyces glaucescens]
MRAVHGAGRRGVRGADLARSLGVPTGTVAAARAVLEGAERRLDLLVDDSDGVVVGAVGIPPLAAGREAPEGATAVSRPWLRTCQSLVRTLVPARPARVTPAALPAATGPARLRVEVDGETLVDLGQPLEAVSVTPDGSGSATVEVRPVSVGAAAAPLLGTGRRITVSGADFRYRADAVVAGPVRRRTWTVFEGGLGLTLPTPD